VYGIGRRCPWASTLGIAAVFSFLGAGHPAFGQNTVLFERHVVDADFAGLHAVEDADLDGDGDTDLFGAAMTASEVMWWENTDGEGGGWAEHLVAGGFAGARSVAAADLDGDGDPDLVGAAAGSDLVAWWENTDGTALNWVPHTVTDSFDFVIYVRVADLDGDGDPDLLGAALRDDAIAWWENADGRAGAWTEHRIDEAFDGARFVMAADLDSDGDPDLVGAADVGDEVAWWENATGDATAWVKHPVDSMFNGANSAHAVDLDGDGDSDLLGSADAADQVVWWENAGGAAAWTRRLVDPSFDGAFSSQAADFDGDGDLDVIAAAAEGDLVAWWENAMGDGVDWVEHEVEPFYDFATHICAADIDGDGDRDAIGGHFGGEVSWWENHSDRPGLPVSLVRFEAAASGAMATLMWETASETSNAGFEVHHARDDGPFARIGFVEGAGTVLALRTYRYSVAGLGMGLHRFRLRQVDFDGRGTLSPEVGVFVPHAGRADVSVYPNPFNPNAQMTLVLRDAQPVRVEVYDTVGRRVALLHEGMLDAERVHGFAFDASGLPGGLYVFQATGTRFTASDFALLVK
jgi:hypothetical protein